MSDDLDARIRAAQAKLQQRVDELVAAREIERIAEEERIASEQLTAPQISEVSTTVDSKRDHTTIAPTASKSEKLKRYAFPSRRAATVLSGIGAVTAAMYFSPGKDNLIKDIYYSVAASSDEPISDTERRSINQRYADWYSVQCSGYELMAQSEGREYPNIYQQTFKIYSCLQLTNFVRRELLDEAAKYAYDTMVEFGKEIDKNKANSNRVQAKGKSAYRAQLNSFVENECQYALQYTENSAYNKKFNELAPEPLTVINCLRVLPFADSRVYKYRIIQRRFAQLHSKNVDVVYSSGSRGRVPAIDEFDANKIHQ